MSISTLVCLIPFSFQWNSSGIPLESTGIPLEWLDSCRIPPEFLWIPVDSTGIPLEWPDSCRNRWGTVKYWVPRLPHEVTALADHFGTPELPELVQHILYQQENPDSLISLGLVPLDNCSSLSHIKVHVYASTLATYFAPSDKSGTQGMFHECIWAVSSWRKGPPRYDCAFVKQDSMLQGFHGLLVACVHSFLLIQYHSIAHPCALVSWYSVVGDQPCRDRRMWKVKPDLNDLRNPTLDIIHLDSILHNAHLMGACEGSTCLPHNFTFNNSLDSFKAFYITMYIDYHAHKIAF